MKEIVKRTLAVLLASAAVVSLAGCGEGNTQTSQSSISSGGSSAANGGDTQGVSTIRILSSETDNPYIKLEDREEYEIWGYLEKLFADKDLALDIEIIPVDQYQVVLQTRLASANDLPDYVNLTPMDDTTALNLATNGTLLPANDIFENYGDGSAWEFLKENADFAIRASTAEDGNMYWIPNAKSTYYQDEVHSTCQIIAIRKDWLEKLNLDAPENAEDFVAVMKAFRDQDANGNGVADEILGFDPSVFLNGIAQWFGLGTDLASIDIQNQKVVSPWYQDGVKEYFSYLNRLVQENILDTTLIGAASSDPLNQKMAENKVGATFTYAMQKWLEPSIKAEDPQFLPIGPLPAVEGITPINAIEPPFLAWKKWAFTKACTDLDAAGRFLDVIYSDEYRLISDFGIEGQTYDIVDGEPKLRDDVINNSLWEKMAEDRISTGGYLWGSLFPGYSRVDMSNEINDVEPWKSEYQLEVLDYQPTHPDNPNPYLALPTEEQLERKADIITDLETYSKELAANLILGNESLDDWDTYMEEFKELGLDEYLEIVQDQLDRFNAQ